MDEWVKQFLRAVSGTEPNGSLELLNRISSVRGECPLDSNLLSAFSTYWQLLADSFPSDRRSRRWKRMIEWTATQVERSAVLSDSWPGCLTPSHTPKISVDRRLVYWPQGLPDGAAATAGIVSSRIGRRLVEHGEWFQLIRSACRQIREHDSLLIAAEKSSLDRPIARAAANCFDLKLCLLRDRPCRDAVRWFWNLIERSLQADDFETCSACISPQICPPDLETIASVPFRDRVIVEASNTLFVLHVRPGGNIERLLRARISNLKAAARTFIPLGTSLLPESLVEELTRGGAVGWEPHLDAPLRQHPPATPGGSQAASAEPRIVRCGESGGSIAAGEWCYLTHCTRTRSGPWPGQSDDEYFSDLLNMENSYSCSPAASLERIIQEKRLRSSEQGIRGKFPVVCFSERPLGELIKLRAYRAHRGRWDFEPYGICILRKWLIERGTRCVIYGSDADWQKLAQADRPFFQRSGTTTRRGRIIDWTQEREWRHPGDIDLAELDAGSALVFVPTEDEALRIAETSPWPILVLGNSNCRNAGPIPIATSAPSPARRSRRNARA